MKALDRFLAAALGGVIRAYQVVLAPLLPPVCRFEPSCSRYAAEALGRYGAFRGAWRSLGRILRCHPFHPGGVDRLT